uniref:Major facilitator superfamily (MFS) profile domain-containing protein n=1 Tax=Globisporangium ultimum (strain ATCC 200006 / CBS 805.95 / DAOM BR144) TaxID=431595 RepID=K3XAV2_GLOUD
MRLERLQRAIEKTTDGYFQLRTVLILGLGNAADAIEILSIGYILVVYEDKDGTLTRAQQSVLAAAIFAGMFVGGIFFGALSDQIGRRKSLLYSLLVNALFALLSSVSPNIYALIAFRTCAGIGIGGTVPAMFTLCSEHVPVNRRGFYVTIVASYWMVGSVFTAGLAWFMLGNPDSHYSWRSFAAIVSIPAFVCWYLTYQYVPESAQYFARRRQFSDAEAVVNHIHLTNENGGGRGNGKDKNVFAHEATGLLSPFKERVTSDASYLANIESDHHGEASEKTLTDTYQSLFDPILRTTTISLLMSWFCLSFGSYGLATWITVLFKRIGLSDPFANAFIYAAANLPGNLLSAFLMDKLGGRKILAMSMLLSAACAAGFAYVSAGDEEDVATATTTVLIVLLTSGFNAFSTSGWNAIDLMSAESFPTDVRTTGMGLLSASGRTGSVIAQFINGYLVGPPPHITLLLTVTATMMLLGSISSVLVRDYNGKTLPASVEAMRSEKGAKVAEFVRFDKH